MRYAAIFVMLSFFIEVSCVSTKYYNGVVEKNTKLETERDSLRLELQDLQADALKTRNDYDQLRAEHQNILGDKSETYQSLKSKLKRLREVEESYNLLDKNRTSTLALSAQKNRELLALLEVKKDSINVENTRLGKLKETIDSVRAALNDQTEQVSKLNQLISEKNKTLALLKNNIKNSLLNFEGKGITIEQRMGKIYVSMENKLLFGSGSWEVGVEGQRALKDLGSLLSKNPNISILVEGHTDDIPYAGNSDVFDNWDLSTKRATSVVRVLQKTKGVLPENLTAAGKSQYSPVANNSTAEGKSKNRRIDIVLSPKLDTVMNLLNDTK